MAMGARSTDDGHDNDKKMHRGAGQASHAKALGICVSECILPIVEYRCFIYTSHVLVYNNNIHSMSIHGAHLAQKLIIPTRSKHKSR